MKSGKMRYLLAATLCVMVFSVAGIVGASDIGGVVKQACTKCHSSKRICLNLGVKSGPAWQSTVKKMVGKGAQLPGERVEEAASYLSGLAPGAGPLCQ